MKIVIPTCDKYLHAVECLLHTIDKLWKPDDEVIVLGYAEPNYELKENQTFVSLGVDRGPRYWTTDVASYLKNFEDEYFILANDDTVILQPVDKDYLKHLEELMKEDDISRMSLTESCTIHPHGPYKSFEDHNIVLANQDAPYRVHLQWTMFKTEYLLKYLLPDRTPWEFELHLARLTLNDGAKICSTQGKMPISIGHMYKKYVLQNDWHINFRNHDGWDEPPMDSETKKEVEDILAKHGKLS